MLSISRNARAYAYVNFNAQITIDAYKALLRSVSQ